MRATRDRGESPVLRGFCERPGSASWKAKAALAAGVAVPLGLFVFADTAAAEFSDLMST